MDLLEKFLKYVSFDTQSDEVSTTSPSTLKQKKLAEFLTNELRELGVDNAFMTEYGYVYASIPANIESDNALGLIAHMDTSPDASGANIKPSIEIYNGGDLLINKDLKMFISEKALRNHLGHQIIHTDGTTLLGADDKAGVAIIMEVVETLMKNKDIKHPLIKIAFTPDEEVGRGTEHFDVDYFKKNTKNLLSYTLDGDEINIIAYENFNAASASVKVNGVSIHPGSAKGVMVNSQIVAMEYFNLLPPARPENTEKYEGFIHLHGMEGDVTTTNMYFIIRNHDAILFEKAKLDMINACESINKKYGEGTIEISIKDSYRNMKEIVMEHQDAIELPIKALEECGLKPSSEPIRGGTDGATLSFKGIVCPNLGTGCGNFHGPYEFADFTDMQRMVEVVLKMIYLLK